MCAYSGGCYTTLHEVPKGIVSDRDTHLTGDSWKRLCKQLPSKQIMSTAYHAQTDSQPERINQAIEQTLRCSSSRDYKTWDNVLPLLTYACKSIVHSSSNCAPFELLPEFVAPKPVRQQLQLPATTATELLPVHARTKVNMARRGLRLAQEYQGKYPDQRNVRFIPKKDKGDFCRRLSFRFARHTKL